jgi:hypothetical protein
VEGTVDVSFLFFGGSLFAEHFVTSKNGINRQLSDFLLIKQRQRDREGHSFSDVMTLGLSKKLRSEAILIALISSCCRGSSGKCTSLRDNLFTGNKTTEISQRH